MIRNYLKVAFRNFFRNKVYSFINITGLAAGMTVALLIGMWVWDEITFDDYHRNNSRVAGIMSTTTFDGETSTNMWSCIPLANELHDKYPGDFKNTALVSGGRHVLTTGDKNITQWGMWAQPAFPAMFSFNIIKGNSDALKDPSSVLLNESLAKVFFGEENPIGKTIRLDNKADLNIGGVYEDLPRNSSFSGLAYLLSWDTYINTEPGMMEAQTNWNNHHFQLFAELNEHANLEKINARIKNITQPHISGKSYEQIMLHPMSEWHLYNEFRNGKKAGGRIQFVWLFGIAGIFVLLLACINFMNLSTARSEKRAKEVGIRKTIGSLRGQLIGQFLSESLMVTFLAFILSILLMQLFLPFFNDIAGKQMSVPYSNPFFWLLTIGFTVFTALVSGSYPAFYLSAFQPVKVLKGTFRAGRYTSLPRKILVTVQFTVSIALIIGTLIVFRQIQYAKDRPVGYDREALIAVSMKTPEIRGHYDAFRNDLLQTGAVDNMAESSSPSTNVVNDMLGFRWKGKDPDVASLIGTISVTHDFGKTIGWEIKEGRDFSRQFPGDSGSLIINEATAKLTGFKNPVGETMHWMDRDRVVIGVVKDMVMESPYMPVRPTVFFLDYKWRTSFITLRLNKTLPLNEALAKVEPVFKKYDPASPFTYTFAGNEFERKFYGEQQISKLAGFFAVLAIFISCLGLFGLASFVAEQRTKEIGIRKVLGASVFSVWKLLSKEFVTLVILSCLIAVPVAWYFLHQWLEKYPYRISLSAWIFAMAGIGALVISLLTVSFQSIKAGLMNPVRSLRSE